MLPFEFQTAPHVIVGRGTLSRLPQLSKGFGTKALAVTGRDVSRAAEMLAALRDAGVSTAEFAVAGEPTLDEVRAGVRRIKAEGLDLVIGFGGGSAIDAAKAMAVIATNSGEPLDYLEVIGRGGSLENAPLPCIAIPTTAGTGAEVTRNAVLSSPDHELKCSLRGPYLLPQAAIVDPELTMHLPPRLTANTGLDALTQLLEAFVSHRANSFTRMLCREGLKRVGRSLPVAYRAAVEGRLTEKDADARDDMAFGSLLSGMALANAGLGAVHGFASPLGGMLGAPHGAVCAALLPTVVRVNVRALHERDPRGASLAAYTEAAEILTGASDPDRLDRWLSALCSELKTDQLRALGLQEANIEDLLTRAAAASSMKGNPIALTQPEMRRIVAEAF